MCQNTKNMKITPVTDICSKGDFVKKRVLTPSYFYNLPHNITNLGSESTPDLYSHK